MKYKRGNKKTKTFLKIFDVDNILIFPAKKNINLKHYKYFK